MYIYNYEQKYIFTYAATSASNQNGLGLMEILVWNLSVTHIFLWFDIPIVLNGCCFCCFTLNYLLAI